MKKILVLITSVIVLSSFGLFKKTYYIQSTVIIRNSDTTKLYIDGDCPISTHLKDGWEKGRWGKKPKIYILTHIDFLRMAKRSIPVNDQIKKELEVEFELNKIVLNND